MTNDKVRPILPERLAVAVDYLAGYDIRKVPATPTVRAAALSALAETDAVLIADLPPITFLTKITVARETTFPPVMFEEPRA